MRLRAALATLRAWLRKNALLWSAVLVVVAIAAIAVWPALRLEGLWATRAAGDSPFLLQRVHQYAQMLGAGHFPPRWMPGAAYGMGYPFWNFYAPLAYLAAAPLALAGGGVVGSIKVVALTAFVVAATGAYALGVLHWRSRAAGVVAAAAYTYAPYHMANLYVRGDALSELVAYGIFPWLLVAIEAARTRRHGAAVAGLAVAAAGLLLAHNVSALLFAPLAAAYAIWRVLAGQSESHFDRLAAPEMEPPDSDTIQRAPPVEVTSPARAGVRDLWTLGPWATRRVVQRVELAMWPHPLPRRARGAIAVLVASVLGLALAAWFWMPALAERDAVHLDQNLTGYFAFDARDDTGALLHFRGRDLVQLTPQIDYEPGTSCAPCRVGAAQLAIALVGAAVLVLKALRRKKGRTSIGGIRGSVVFWLVAALATTFMITPASLALWERVPLLDFAQFPWRWLAVQSLTLAMLAGGVGLLPGRGLPAALASLTLVVAGLAALHPEVLPVHDVTEADLTTFELFSTNIGSTVRAEYLPSAVSPRPWSGPDAALGAAGEPRVLAGSIASPVLWTDSPDGQVWGLEVTGSVTATVAFPIYWFPGWHVRLQPESNPNAPVEWAAAGPVDGSGWLAAQIPAGRWRVEIAKGRSGTQAAAEGLSLLAAVALLALVAADRGVRALRWIVFAIAISVLAVAGAYVLPTGEAEGPVSMDRERIPYPHHNPGGIAYASSRLMAVSFTPSEAAPGGSFTARLQWRNPFAGTVVTMDLVSPAEPVYGVPDIIATAQATQSDENQMVLAIPPDTPPGLYFARIAVTNNGQSIPAIDATGRVAQSATYLGPVRVTGQGAVSALPPNPLARMAELTLHDASATQDRALPELLTVHLLWQTSRPTVSNYATSVRLLDSDGGNVAQEDKEPRYGFYPTTMWRTGEQVRDVRWLSLPADLPSGDDYILEVVAYEAHSDRVLGTARVEGVSVVSPAAPRPRGGEALPTVVPDAPGGLPDPLAPERPDGSPPDPLATPNPDA